MEQHGISKLDLKRQNRMQILKILKQRGPTSRIDIASTLELTRAAVTIITNEMIEQGIITEVGEYKHATERAPRGRKKILLDINHNYKFAVGVIVEEDIVSIGLSTLAGEVLDKRNLPINDDTYYDDILVFIDKSLNEILKYNCLSMDCLLGIGLGVMPKMYPKMRIDVVDKVADYSKIIKEFLNFTKLPVAVDNSVKGTAMANIDFQKFKDPNRHNIAFLQYGEDFNFVVTNLNDPIVSYDNRTNFVDNIIINPQSEYIDHNHCKRGCVKSELSPSAIIKKVNKIYGVESTPVLYKLTEGNINDVTINNIRKSMHKGDTKIKKIYCHIANLMAVLINNLVFTTNPQKLVLHDFKLSDDEFIYLKNLLKNVSGEEVSNLIDLSIIEDKHRFLAGSAIAIRELFFTTGGFAPHLFE